VNLVKTTAVVAGLLLLGACVRTDEPPPGATPPSVGPARTIVNPTEPADPYLSLVAHARVKQLPIFRTRQSSKPFQTLANPTPVGAPLVLLVQEETEDWVRVLLPLRPNGSEGWIRTSQVELLEHRFRIEVDLSAHRITVTEGKKTLLKAPVGIGTKDTPTPGGLFFIKELLRPPDPDTIYGKYAYGLSGFSTKLRSFAGGEGVIGIHGTNAPETVGKTVSHGCIRMYNRDIAKLVPVLPLGTPVRIVR
jgi:lipoprotein-anchoring transpeptidase ErfK/SrfK